MTILDIDQVTRTPTPDQLRENLVETKSAEAKRSRVSIHVRCQAAASRASDSGLDRLRATNPENSGRPVG